MSLKYRIADATFRVVKEKWGVTDNGKVIHPHPVLANERNLARAATLDRAVRIAGLDKYKKAFSTHEFAKIGQSLELADMSLGDIASKLGTIVNIGGRPILDNCLFVKAMQPIVLPSDYNRYQEYVEDSSRRVKSLKEQIDKELNYPRTVKMALEDQWICQHKFGECTCYPNVKVFVSIHSLYYLQPEDIFRVLIDTGVPLVAAFHQFPAPFGSLGYGEAKYSWNPSNGEINMSVNGNMESYVHGDLSWLWGGSWSAGFAGTLTWSTYQVIGETVIAVFRATRMVIPKTYSTAPNLMAGLKDQRYVGDISWSTIKDDPKSYPDYGSFTVTSALGNKLFSYLGWVVAGEDYDVYVPKSLVYDLAQRCVGKKRDKSLLDTLVLHARANVRKLAMDEEKRMKSVIFASYLAMSVGAEMELDAIVSHSSKKHKWGLLNKYYEDGITIIPRWAGLLAAAVVGTAVVVAPVKPRYKLLGLSVVTGMIGIMMKKPPSPGATAHKVTNVCVRGIKTEVQRLGSVINVTDDKECYPGFGAQLFGFGVKGVSPTVARGCVHNDYYALRNRVLVENRDILLTPKGPIAEELNWDDVHELIPNLKDLHPLSKISTPVRALPFEVWLSSIPLSGSRKAMLSRMRDTLKHKSFNKTMAYLREWARQAFTKIEKVVGNPEACPRMISGSSPAYQVATGPITKALAIRLKDTWTMDNYLTYASGKRPSDLGAFVEQLDDMPPIPGGYVLLEMDFGRFDATQSQGSLKVEMIWYDEAGVSGKHLAILKLQWVSHGVTSNAVYYFIMFTRNSGDGNTSGGNSLTNGYVVIAAVYLSARALRFISEIMKIDITIQIMVHKNYTAFEEFLRKYTRMIVLGDDNLAIVPRLLLDKDAVEKHLKDKGLRPEMIVRDHVWDAEFCSGRFYPSSKGTRWGPKIGRFLAKTGWALKPYGKKKSKMWLRGVATGMLVDFGHIPVLRVCLRKILELTHGSKPLAEIYLRKYRWYEHEHEAAEATEQTLLMCCHIYGCTIEDINDLERDIASTNSLPRLLDHPLALRMVQVDNKIKYEENAAIEDTGPKHIPGSTFTLANMKRMAGEIWAWLKVALPALMESSIFDVVFVAPFMEEGAKRMTKFSGPISFACAAIVTFEALNHVNDGGELMQYFPTAVMHIVCDQLPFLSGTAVHMLFNFWAVSKGGSDLPPWQYNLPGGDVGNLI